MKDKLFYSTNSGQVMRRLGFGFDFSMPYYDVSVSSKRAKFGFSVSRIPAVLAISSVVSSSVKGGYRLFGKIFEAFRIVISSPVI